MKRKILSICIGYAVIFGRAASAEEAKDSVAELRQEVRALSMMVQKLQSTVESQQQIIAGLRQVRSADSSANATEPIAAAQSVVASRTESVSQAAAAGANGPARGSGIFIPDIGVVGDLVGQLSQSREDEEGNDRFSAREVELVLGHDVDPFGRFDATIAFSDSESPDLEEAYYTSFALPAGFVGRFGRIRPNVGISPKQHRDSLDTVDEPLVVQRLFGAEGYSRSGVELSTYLPLPWEDLTHDVSFGVLEGGVGDGAELFGETRRAPTLYARLRNAWDIDDLNAATLGTSFLAGSADDDGAFESRVVGVDSTLVHHFDSTRKLKFQGEAYLQDRSAGIVVNDESSIVAPDGPAFNTNPFGAYLLTDVRFAERWSAGGRWDFAEPVNDSGHNERDHESALSGFLSFYQSEFARWRFQYQYAELLDGNDDNRFFLQGTFALGTHKHSLQ